MKRTDSCLIAIFTAVWEALAECGYCDHLGGAEYHRVSDAWIKADCPEDGIGRFILDRVTGKPGDGHAHRVKRNSAEQP